MTWRRVRRGAGAEPRSRLIVIDQYGSNEARRPAWAEPYSHRRIDRNAPTIIALEPERATGAAACCNTGRSRTCRRSRSWTSPARSHTWGSNSRMGHRTLASELRSVSCILRCSSVRNHRRGPAPGGCTGCQAGPVGKVPCCDRVRPAPLANAVATCLSVALRRYERPASEGTRQDRFV